MLEYPANSAGDFFRLLPFEGYMGVLSFLPATCLAGAVRVSKGWRYAVGCRGDHDLSITCTSVSHLKDFLKLILNLAVSSISCDISDLCELNRSDLFSLSLGKHCQMRHVIWRCKSLDTAQGGDILRLTFPNLKSLKVDFTAHPLEKIGLPGFNELAHLSVVNSGGSRKKLVTDLHGVHWTGYNLPMWLRSLSLEGVNFAHAEKGGVNFNFFLANCSNLESLHLDLPDGWWKTCGSRFERGVVEWIKSRPGITHFYVKQLSQDRHLQIQELLREPRERRELQLSKSRSFRIVHW